jgi:hypothetical protein
MLEIASRQPIASANAKRRTERFRRGVLSQFILRLEISSRRED